MLVQRSSHIGLLGRQEVAKRLFGDLEVDITQTKEILGWEPPYTVAESFKRTFET